MTALCIPWRSVPMAASSPRLAWTVRYGSGTSRCGSRPSRSQDQHRQSIPSPSRRMAIGSYRWRRPLSPHLGLGEQGGARKLTGHGDEVWGAFFSPDGKSVVWGSHDQTIRHWDAATGAELDRLTGHTVPSMPWRSIRIDLWSRRVAQTGPPTFGRPRSGPSRPPEWPYRRGSRDAFSSDGTRIVTAGYDKTGRIWDAADARDGAGRGTRGLGDCSGVSSGGTDVRHGKPRRDC